MLGLEPRTYGLKGRCSIPEPTEPQALSERTRSKRTKRRTKDTDLDTVCDAWPALPEAVKAGILAMVLASTSTAQV